MKKIVHLTSVHSSADPRIFLKECRTLAQHGYDVVLIGPGKGEQRLDGVRLRPLDQADRRLARMTITSVRALKVALEEKAALYHVHDPELLPVALVLRLAGRRVVFDMHENMPAAIQTRPWIPSVIRPFLRAGYRVVERALLHRLPVVFAETSYESEYPFLQRTVTVLNMPILDDIISVAGDKYEVPTVGYIGAVSRARGFDVMVAALKLLNGSGYTVHGECIGLAASDIHSRLSDAARSSSLPLRLRGPLSHAEGMAMLARCQVGLAVLQPVPNYINSYPTKIFEYMALGLPVVASAFPLYRSIVERERCGLCVDPTDAQDVAAAIRWLLQNPAEAAEMGRRGQEVVRSRYNWSSEARKLIAFYSSLLDAS